MGDNQAQKKYFAVKGTPNRPTFNQDITEEEQNIMKQNVTYWNNHNNSIFVGAVLGTDGYGLVVIEAEGEDEAQAIAAEAPVAKAGFMTIEICPMLVVKHR